jgi:hypothetical protein
MSTFKLQIENALRRLADDGRKKNSGNVFAECGFLPIRNASTSMPTSRRKYTASVTKGLLDFRTGYLFFPDTAVVFFLCSARRAWAHTVGEFVTFVGRQTMSRGLCQPLRRNCSIRTAALSFFHAKFP